MKKSEKKLLGLEIFLILLFLINLIFLQANNYIIAIAIIIIFFISTFLLGFEEDRHRFKKDGILYAIIFSIVYELFIYICGIFLGFLKSGYSLSLISIFRNIIPFAMIIFTGEILRHEFMIKGEKKKIFFILTLILFILIDSSANIFIYNIDSSRVALEAICLIVIPSMSKNLLLTYWMNKFGILANVIYLCITSLLVFLIPIIPDFNKYLQAIIALVYPAIVYFITKAILKDYKKENSVGSKILSKVVTIIVIVFSLTIIALTSGIFKYYFLTIGSGSMRDKIDIGDVVIVKKLKTSELNEIEVGKVLVFKMDNKVIVHRVVDIKKDNDGSLLFKTKGDANKENDNWYVSEGAVIGTTDHLIPMVGLPSVWLYEFIEGRKME